MIELHSSPMLIMKYPVVYEEKYSVVYEEMMKKAEEIRC